MSNNIEVTATHMAHAQTLLSPETRELGTNGEAGPAAPFPAAKKRQAARGERGVVVTMTSDGLMAKLHAANYRCALSGVEFGRDPFGRFGPTLPSLDRIDPDGPYSDDNTRVVSLHACPWFDGDEVPARQPVWQEHPDGALTSKIIALTPGSLKQRRQT